MNILHAALLFMLISGARCSGWTEYETYIQSQATNETFLKLFQEHLKQFESTEPEVYSKFPCNAYSRKNATTNINKLSPADVSVVAALGDSITAGTGITATSPLGLLVQNRGLSWSIGGDGSVEEHVTIPNIIKKYNPNVRGFSVGNGKVYNKNSHLNLAEPGDTSFDVISKVKELIGRMHHDSGIDFQNDWKLITILIGVNDLCFYCSEKKTYSPEHFVDNIRESLDILHKDVPRTFVNLVQVPTLAGMNVLNVGALCDTIHMILCHCGAYPTKKEKEIMRAGVHMYQEGLRDLIDSGRYDTRDDFTVVIQPFYQETQIPKLADGRADLSYFAPDCMHFSRKGHKAVAEALWDNMIEPIGQKRRHWTPQEPVECPTSDNPYFYTRLNSDLRRASDDVITQDADNSTVDSDNKVVLNLSVAVYAGLVVILSITVFAIVFMLRRPEKDSEHNTLLPTGINSWYSKM